MYGKMSGISLSAGGAAGTAAIAQTLPFTGLPLWMVLVMVFTLVAAGTALLRLVPRRQG